SDARAIRQYWEAVLENERGNLRSALRHFRDAAESSARLGLEEDRVYAIEREADTLQALGRVAEGEALLVEARTTFPDALGSCKKAVLLENIGWFVLQARDAGTPLGKLVESPVPVLREALAIYRSPSCENPEEVANVLTDLALASVSEGRPDEARRFLDE